VTVLAGPLVAAGPAASASVRRCASTAASATILADPPWPQQRFDLAALSQINAGSGVTVAVIDSGVDAGHPQLTGAVPAGDDLLDTHGDGREDCVGHGTAVASIIAARPVPGSGLRGVAPGVRILPIRVSERVEVDGSTSGDGNLAGLIAGIQAAVSAKPRPAVINLSLSTTVDSPGLRAAVRAALDADIVVVAAAGNQHEQGDPPPYPANYDGVVGVGAIAPDGTREAGSQIGSYVDIVAPGDQVVGAVPHRGHATFQGTSFATPFVSATAALIRARFPRLNRTEVVHRLLATTDPAAGARPSTDYGYGVVNPVRALTEILTPESASGGMAEAALQPGTADRQPPDGAGSARVVGVAALIALAAAAIAAVALAFPLARQRRWRPGPTNL
jgi:type VII secretion-associated serine protease mycosin